MLGDVDRDARFDAITLWDVVEHLDEPESVLRDAVPLLKPDGVAIVETGNFQSAARISDGADWWAYAADHRWYFAPPTLRDLLRRVGLPHVALANRVLRPWWRGEHSYAGPSRRQLLRQLVRSPLSASTALSRYRSLRQVAAGWQRWGGLGIFALVASRNPIAPRAKAAGLIPL
jgi:2-polyprenyl-3-methyl-5-hydroxy-6-metoxy-1,4-benzoquinol methylase